MGFMTKTVSNIRGFNVRLYPICLNYSQLVELYGYNATTWMANTASASWLCVNDAETIDKLAQTLGRYTTDGMHYYNLREPSELGKLTSREGGLTVITRNGKSPLLVRRINYDIAFSRKMFAPDPEHPLTGWARITHALQRAWYRITLWI